jgi:ABC-type multidrug transport system ATPase subunit
MIERKAEELEELPGSSRRYPKFRFEPRRPSGKDVLKISGIRKSYGDKEVLHGVDLQVRRGDRLVIMGPNGIGKSTLLKIVMGEVEADAGEVEWGYETHPGYFAQDHKEQVEESDRTAEAWLWDFCPDRDRGFVRGHMGMVLFSGDDGAKRLSALSGGEAARLVFARLALERPNVLVLDEPTNHLDLESIEALVQGLTQYEGTLILVSHDRWFVGELATRVVEIRTDGIRDYHGTYEEYVQACGDDHLDAENVVLKAKKEGRERRTSGGANGNGPSGLQGDGARVDRGGARVDPRVERGRLERKRDEITDEVERVESRIAEIDALFCRPGYYDETATEEVTSLEREREQAQERASALVEEWETVERALAALDEGKAVGRSG